MSLGRRLQRLRHTRRLSQRQSRAVAIVGRGYPRATGHEFAAQPSAHHQFGAYLEALGNAIAVEDGKITVTADKIVLAGLVYLGGADASKPAAMEGSTDTAGYAEVGNLATQVFVK